MGWGGHQAEHLIYREASQTSNLQPLLPRKKTHQIYINPRNIPWQKWDVHVHPSPPRGDIPVYSHTKLQQFNLFELSEGKSQSRTVEWTRKSGGPDSRHDMQVEDSPNNIVMYCRGLIYCAKFQVIPIRG